MTNKGKVLVAVIAAVVVLAGGVGLYLKGGDLLGYLGLSSKVTFGTVANEIGTRRAEIFHDDVTKHNNGCDATVAGYDGYCYLQGEGLVEGKGMFFTQFSTKLKRGDAAVTVQRGLNLEVLADADYKNSLYTDIPSGTFYDVPAYALGYLGIPSVKAGGKFYPDDYLTKGRFDYWLKNLDKVLDSGVTNGEMAMYAVVNPEWDLMTPATPTFSDVPATSKYYAYIETITTQGMVSSSDGTYKPNQTLNRAKAAKFIAMAFELPIANVGSSTFADVSTNNEYLAYIETLVTYGILVGQDAYFHPGDTLTHAAALEWFTRAKNSGFGQ